MKIKNYFFYLFGFYFILISLLAYYNVLKNKEYFMFFWISYSIFLITGIGLLIKNSKIIASQLNIILIPYIIWIIDFFYFFFTSQPLFNVATYFFTLNSISEKIVTFQHIVIIPISLTALYFLKIKKSDFWKISIIQISTIFILTRVFTSPERNINCAFKNCLLTLKIPYFPIAWFLIYITIILSTNFILIKIFKPSQQNQEHLSSKNTS